MKQEFPGQRNNEKILYVFRRHWLAMRKGFIGMLVLMLAGFVPFAISPANSNLLWVALAGIVIGILVFIYHWIGWYFSVYIVTNQRIRQDRQKGIFNSSVVEIALDKVHNISAEKHGLAGNLFNYGTLVLQTYVGDLVITMVPGATDMRERLQEEINQYGDKLTKENDERQD